MGAAVWPKGITMNWKLPMSYSVPVGIALRWDHVENIVMLCCSVLTCMMEEGYKTGMRGIVGLGTEWGKGRGDLYSPDSCWTPGWSCVPNNCAWIVSTTRLKRRLGPTMQCNRSHIKPCCHFETGSWGGTSLIPINWPFIHLVCIQVKKAPQTKKLEPFKNLTGIYCETTF